MSETRAPGRSATDEERLRWVRLGVQVLAVVAIAVIAAVGLYHNAPTVAAALGVLVLLPLLAGRPRSADNPGAAVWLKTDILAGVTIAALAAVAVVALITNNETVGAVMGALIVIVVVLLIGRDR